MYLQIRVRYSHSTVFQRVKNKKLCYVQSSFGINVKIWKMKYQSKKPDIKNYSFYVNLGCHFSLPKSMVNNINGTISGYLTRKIWWGYTTDAEHCPVTNVETLI